MDLKNQIISRAIKILMFVSENEGSNIKNISNELGIDYNYVGTIINEFSNINMVITKIENRNKTVSTTNKGNELVSLYEQIEELI